MQLFVFSTARKIREFLSERNDELIPKTLTLQEFFKKAIFVKNLAECPEIERILFMQKACEDTKNFTKELKFPSEFYEFMRNSNYLFSFFKELCMQKVSVEKLATSDTYAHYDEHLQILDELFKNYDELLKSHGFYDEITITQNYEINEAFAKNYTEIFIQLDGILSNFELEILEKLAKFCKIEIQFQTSKLGDKIFTPPQNSLINFKITKSENENLAQIKPFSLRSTQTAFVFEKISTFVKDGILPEKIAVILPDEKFAEILKAHDKENMLNFAMGTKFQSTIFYQLFSLLTQILKEKTEPNFYENSEEIDFFDERSVFLHELNFSKENFKIWQEIYNKTPNFAEFENLIFSLFIYDKNSQNENFQNIVKQALIELNIVVNNQNFNLNFAQMCEILQMILENKTLDFVGGGKVSVMGILETRGMKFDGVIIVDFNDDLIPTRVVNEMFLNSKVRENAGLISHERRENLQRFYYESLIKRAKKVAISYQISDDKLPSRFLKKLKVVLDQSYTEADYLALFGEKSESLKLCQAEISPFKFDFTQEIFSASKLATLLRCKRQFYYKYIAKIYDPKSFENDENRHFIGLILHESLNEIYQNLGDFDYEKFAEIFTKKAKIAKINELDIKLNLKRVKNVEAKIFSDLKNNGFKFLTGELKISKENPKIYRDFKICGSIDRIDINENGKKLIIDYKSGKIDEHPYQIAFYEALLNERCGGVFLSFKECDKKEPKVSLNENYKDYPSLNEIFDRLKMASGSEFNFDCTDFIFRKKPETKICEKCPFKILCKGELK